MSITIKTVIMLHKVAEVKARRWCVVCTGEGKIGGRKVGITINGRVKTEQQADELMAAIREANE